MQNSELTEWIVAEPYNEEDHGPREGFVKTKMHMIDLLFQEEWWQPQYGPAVRILDMTDTHRWNTLRWLERRSWLLMDAVVHFYLSGPQPSGEMASDDFDREVGAMMRTDPLTWLRSTPLHEALSRRMPTPHAGKRSRKRWGRMMRRAKHYSTCPRNRNLKADECSCRRESQERALTASSGLSV